MNPNTGAVFDSVGLDYFCHGTRQLGDALRDRGVPFDAFVEELARTAEKSYQPDWSQEPLGSLIAHILEAHHGYLQRELPVLDEWAAQLARSSRDATIGGLHRVVHGLRRDLELQMRKEEKILFPAIQNLEAAVVDADHACPFGSVANLLRETSREHEKTARGLLEIDELLGSVTGGTAERRELDSRLRELVNNMHGHLHLENNILFPRAIRLEKG